MSDIYPIRQGAHLGTAAVKARVPEGDRHNQNWTPGEYSALESYFEQGASDAVIAKRLGRSPVAVMKRRRSLGLLIEGWRVTEVARMLGVANSTVTRLIQGGFLRARKHGTARRRRTTTKTGSLWIITEADLEPFLRDPNHWHVWTPSSPDSAIREWMAECRGVPMLTIADAMRRYPKVITQAGWVSRIGIHGLPERRDYQGRWLLTEEEVAYLAKQHPAYRLWSPMEDRRLIKLHLAGVAPGRIATSLGRTKWAVKKRLTLLNASKRTVEGLAA